VTVHDVSPLDHPEWFSPRFAKWYAWILPRLTRRSRRIIAVSRYTKERLVNRLDVDPAKITVIYPGVSSRFASSGGDHGAVARRLGLPEKPYVLVVGFLKPRKNLTRLLEAWSRLQATGKREEWLVVVGAGGTSRVFQQLELGPRPRQSTFLGYVSDQDLAVLYSGASAFVFPSLYEGFGSPPLEAMGAGVPCIVGDVGALREVAADAALLVDPLSVDHMKETMRRLLDDGDLRRDLSRRGQARAHDFSYDRAAEETWELLRREAERPQG